MIRFRWMSWGVAAALVGACGDDGAVTTAGMTETSTGTTTTGTTTTTGSTGDTPTTDSPTTGATGDATMGTTSTTSTTGMTTGTTSPTTGMTTGMTTGTTTTTGVMTGSTTSSGLCGDGVLDEGEACDGDQLGDQTCASLGFDDGALACSPTCELDTSGCVSCGDGVQQGGEECDDGNTDPGDGCDGACKVEACDPDGVYTVEGQAIAYTCCAGSVNVNITSFTLAANGALVTSSPSNPVGMSGAETTCPDGNFTNTGMIQGGCTEHYSVAGDFVDANTWMGTYSIEFTGDPNQCSCFNGQFGTPCVNQQFPVTATR